MYNQLHKITTRPLLFKEYTASQLWTDEHVSKQMLQFHIDESNDMASRNGQTIDEIVSFIKKRFNVGRYTSIIDFGCGPGLYSQRLAKVGAKVTGLDFSSRSIDYAKDAAAKNFLNINYICADYLEYKSQDCFDLALLIYCDLCALSPDQRKKLLGNIHQCLKDDGRLVFDLYSLFAFGKKSEAIQIEKNLMHGFWSKNDYFGIMQTFIYESEKVVLDRYDIIEKDQHKVIYNWLEHFDLSKIELELRSAGFEVEDVFSDLKGKKYDELSDEFSIIAKKI